MTQPIFFDTDQMEALRKLLEKAQPHSNKEMCTYYEMYKKVDAALGIAKSRKNLLSKPTNQP